MDKSFSVPISEIVMTDSQVGYVGIASLRTSDFHAVPSEEQVITFENAVPTSPITSPFVVNSSSYYSVGRAPITAPETYQIQAYFLGNSSFDGVATSPASYNVMASSGNLGGGGSASNYKTDNPTTYNKPLEFSNLCANAYTGTTTRTALGDTDNDGVCDTWEPATGSGIITCPEKVTDNVFIDSGLTTDAVVDCNNPTDSYNLCFNDAFASVWGNKADGALICPRKDHKDMFVEMDYFSGYQPSKEAIKDVIMAFGNKRSYN